MARAQVKLRYHGKAFEVGIQSVMAKRLALCGEILASAVRKKLRERSTRTAGPSAPGAIPHADTGGLSKSISYDVDENEMMVRVGTTLEYGRYLEQGTDGNPSKNIPPLAARPYLLPTARSLQRRLVEVMTKKIGDQELGPGLFKIGSE